MTRRAASILMLMLSLPAAALLVAADGVGVDTIRLPSDAGEGLATSKVGDEETQTLPLQNHVLAQPREEDDAGAGEEERPWACCNSTVCTKSFPPTCRCLDEVSECAPACKACEPSGFNPAFHVCKDEYHGDPGPTCAKEERPWACCNSTVCTKSFPPTCRCLDEVSECAPACKACEPSGFNPAFHVCKDEYHGDPGPTCAKEERPWACCNRTVCTKSMPPTCRCLDEVEECAPACKRCDPFGINPKIHVCNDQYHGDPGPSCGKDDHHDDDVPAGSPSLAAAGTQMQLLLVSLVLMFIQSR